MSDTPSPIQGLLAHRATIAKSLAAILRVPPAVREAWVAELQQQRQAGTVLTSWEMMVLMTLGGITINEGFVKGLEAVANLQAAPRN